MADLGYSYDDLKNLLAEHQATGARGQRPIEVSTGEGGGTYIAGYEDTGPSTYFNLPNGTQAQYDPNTDTFRAAQGDMDQGGIQRWNVGQQGVQDLGFEKPRSFGDQLRNAARNAAPYLAGMAGLGIGAAYLPALLGGGSATAGAAGAAEASLAELVAQQGLPALAGPAALPGAEAAASYAPYGIEDLLPGGTNAPAGATTGAATANGANWLQNTRQGLDALNKVRQGISAIRGGGGSSGGGGGGLGGLGGGAATLAAPNMQNYNPTGKFVDPYAVAPVNRAPAQSFGVASLQPQFQEAQQESAQAEDPQFFAAGGMPGAGMGGIAPIHYASGGEYAAGGKYIRGPGDGMSDEIKANIDGNQEARLANSEFVLPADVVSHIGNGSSEAGAKKLYAMMDRIRHARTGNRKQGKQINPDKFLPV
jgi:hypothetical protein